MPRSEWDHIIVTGFEPQILFRMTGSTYFHRKGRLYITIISKSLSAMPRKARAWRQNCKVLSTLISVKEKLYLWNGKFSTLCGSCLESRVYSSCSMSVWGNNLVREGGNLCTDGYCMIYTVWSLHLTSNGFLCTPVLPHIKDLKKYSSQLSLHFLSKKLYLQRTYNPNYF